MNTLKHNNHLVSYLHHTPPNQHKVVAPFSQQGLYHLLIMLMMSNSMEQFFVIMNQTKNARLKKLLLERQMKNSLT